MKNYSVVPQPVSVEILSSEPVFAVNDGLSFEAPDEGERSLNELLSFLKKAFYFEPYTVGKEKIRMEITAEGVSEGYTIRCEKDRVTLKGNDEKGLFYAVQTLKQLLFQGEGTLPEMVIIDYPRYPVRAFMCDCARHFFTVEELKWFIDLMAVHKFNEFHWYMSDDQGYRCENEDKLLLTLIGSRRSHTGFDREPHEGYYTLEDMKEIISYANSRYIRVVPEINSPGHVTAILAAYPELACFPKEFTVSSRKKAKKDILCVGKENTVSFMQSLLSDVSEIFTDNIICIGDGDFSFDRWKKCPVCRKKMAEEKLTTEGELLSYYRCRISQSLEEKGKEVRVRDGSLIRVLEKGEKKNEVILAEKAFRLDLPCRFNAVKNSYTFEAVASEEEKVIGIEACLWTSGVTDMIKAGGMIYPRLAVVSESGWTERKNKDYGDFCHRLKAYRGFYEALY